MTAPPKRTAQDYLGMLKSLLPRGLAWSRARGTHLEGVLYASAEELTRLDAMTHLFIEEANPLTTYHGLEDWEKDLGLPDTCLPAGSSLQERRDAVLAKLRDTGRQDLAYWYELAATLGYSITIEEHWPFICGWHECGDLSGATPEQEQKGTLDLGGYLIGRLGAEEMRYWWNVIVHGDRLVLFRCGESALPERLTDWTAADVLECLMRRDKLAHTLLTFEYEESS